MTATPHPNADENADQKSAVKPRPDGFHTVTPYLLVADVAALLDFLKRAFDARLGDLVDRDGDTIRHAQVWIGDSPVMMGQAPKDSPQSAMLYVYVDDCDQSYRQALSAGATSITPPADQFYGDRTAGVRDPSGTQWWLATHVEDITVEEHRRRAAARR